MSNNNDFEEFLKELGDKTKLCPVCGTEAVEVPLVFSSYFQCPICKEDIKFLAEQKAIKLEPVKDVQLKEPSQSDYYKFVDDNDEELLPFLRQCLQDPNLFMRHAEFVYAPVANPKDKTKYAFIVRGSYNVISITKEEFNKFIEKVT